MDYMTIHLILQGIQLTAALLTGAECICIISGGHTKEVVLWACDTICMQARRKKNRLWDYDRWEEFLRVNGAAYHYGKWINPISYLTLCMALAGVGLVIGFSRGLE